MGKHKVVKCNICSKQMRSDNLKTHLSQHKNISSYPMKSCSTCKKTMISWNLERHEKIHSNAMKNIVEDVRADQIKYTEKEQAGKIVQDVLVSEDVNPKSLSKDNLKALEAYTICDVKQNNQNLNVWQEQLLELMKPSEREIIWVTGQTGGEGKSWFQNYVEDYYESKRVFRSSLNKNAEPIFHALSKRTLELIDVFIFNMPRSFRQKDIPYTMFEDIKDGRTISTKYDSKLLNFRRPNIVIIFSNKIANWAAMSKDRWIKIYLVKNNNEFVIKKGW